MSSHLLKQLVQQMKNWMPVSGKCEEFSDHSQNTCIPSNKQAVVKDRADNVKFELTTLSRVRKKSLAGAFAQNSTKYILCNLCTKAWPFFGPARWVWIRTESQRIHKQHAAVGKELQWWNWRTALRCSELLTLTVNHLSFQDQQSLSVKTYHWEH